jgi:hypothetical protein
MVVTLAVWLQYCTESLEALLHQSATLCQIVQIVFSFKLDGIQLFLAIPLHLNNTQCDMDGIQLFLAIPLHLNNTQCDIKIESVLTVY